MQLPLFVLLCMCFAKQTQFHFPYAYAKIRIVLVTNTFFYRYNQLCNNKFDMKLNRNKYHKFHEFSWKLVHLQFWRTMKMSMRNLLQNIRLQKIHGKLRKYHNKLFTDQHGLEVFLKGMTIFLHLLL